MTANELIEEVELQGGHLWLQGGKLRYRIPTDSPSLLDRVRAHCRELAVLLAERCWHCRGTKTCGCISCWRNGPSACVVCHGSGCARWRVQ